MDFVIGHRCSSSLNISNWPMRGKKNEHVIIFPNLLFFLFAFCLGEYIFFFPSPCVSIFILCPLHPYLNLTYWWLPLLTEYSLAETTVQFSTGGYKFIGLPRGQRRRDSEKKMSLSTDLNALCTWGLVVSSGRKGGSWDLIQGGSLGQRDSMVYAYGVDSKDHRELWRKECKLASRLSVFNVRLHISPAAWSQAWSLLIWAVSFEMG